MLNPPSKVSALQSHDEVQDRLHRDQALPANVQPVEITAVAQIIQFGSADRQKPHGLGTDRQAEQARRTYFSKFPIMVGATAECVPRKQIRAPLTESQENSAAGLR